MFNEFLIDSKEIAIESDQNTNLVGSTKSSRSLSGSRKVMRKQQQRLITELEEFTQLVTRSGQPQLTEGSQDLRLLTHQDTPSSQAYNKDSKKSILGSIYNTNHLARQGRKKNSLGGNPTVGLVLSKKNSVQLEVSQPTKTTSSASQQSTAGQAPQKTPHSYIQQQIAQLLSQNSQKFVRESQPSWAAPLQTGGNTVGHPNSQQHPRSEQISRK